MPKYDVFISYARADKAPVKRIVAALEHLNLKVFLDEKDIPEFAPISDDLRHGLSQAKILLAYYSLTYPQRRACQWELTAAVIAGEGGVAGGTAVQRRVLVVNPLATVDHIEPGTLRDRLCFALPSADDDAALADLAAKVRAHVGDIDTPMTVRSSVKSRLVGGVWTRSPNRFVGRLPEMWDIHTNLRGDAVLLTADGGGHGMAQVQAWGGMGKSLLAEEYGRRFEPAWPGGLFWLKAGGADASTANWQARVEAQLINVIINLKPDIDIVALRQGLKDLDPETRVLVVRARVAELLLYPPDERDNPDKPERPYLWVVDDLPHHTLIETLEAWAAPTPGGRTLFTTRDRGLSGVGKVIDLGVLKPEQAYRLLTAVRVPEGDAEEAAARQIVERLGSYPLAIDVAGQIVDTFATFADLLKVVSSPSTDSEVLAHELEAELPNGHASNIVATLQYSFQHAAGRNPQALTALRTLACLAPQTAVPLDLLSAMVGVDAKRAAKLLDRLSLLDLEEGAVSIHQIIARAIALDSPPDAMVAVKATAVKNFAWVMRAAADIREHRFLSPLIPHVVVLTERANSLDEAELLGWLARYHREAGQAALAEPICRQQMEVYLRRLGAEDRHTLASMHNLASSLRAQGDYVGAQLLQEQVLEVERRVLGEQHPSTLISISSLSATILEKGDHAGARELQELALKAQQGILGMSNLDTLSSMNNLAGTLLIQGEYDEARALQEQVLEVQRSVLGAEHPEYLTSLNNIALTFLAQGEHAQARAL
ncbi:MAG: tetratricopeptide repeat protein, partial [Rhodospirillaceae bacterium]